MFPIISADSNMFRPPNCADAIYSIYQLIMRGSKATLPLRLPKESTVFTISPSKISLPFLSRRSIDRQSIEQIMSIAQRSSSGSYVNNSPFAVIARQSSGIQHLSVTSHALIFIPWLLLLDVQQVVRPARKTVGLASSHYRDAFSGFISMMNVSL